MQSILTKSSISGTLGYARVFNSPDDLGHTPKLIKPLKNEDTLWMQVYGKDSFLNSKVSLSKLLSQSNLIII